MPLDHARMARITEMAHQAFPDQNVIIGDNLGTWVLTAAGEVRLAHENLDIFEAGVALFAHGAQAAESRERLRKEQAALHEGLTVDETRVVEAMEESVIVLIDCIGRALSTLEYGAAELVGALLSLLSPAMIMGCDMTRAEAVDAMGTSYDTAKKSLDAHEAAAATIKN